MEKTNELNNTISSERLLISSTMTSLRNDLIDHTIYVLCMKAYLGLPISMNSSIEGTVFSPRPTTIVPIIRRNKFGFIYIEYNGLKTVDFKNGELRGQLVHSGHI